jgi:hypothetical protein
MFLVPLTSSEKRRIFVVDDTVYNKNRSKKLELLSKVRDYVNDRYVNGFRMITLGFTDGISFIPMDIGLLGTKKIINEANPEIDGRSHGAKRRAESRHEAPKVLLAMIDRAQDVIKAGSYIAFDSWYCNPSLIRELVDRELHVTGRLKNNDTHYLFRRNGKDQFVTLSQLYKKLPRIPPAVRERQRKDNNDVLGSLIVALPQDGEVKPISVKIVFLRNKSSKKPDNWLAILTTDLEMTEEEIIQMYAKRWKIEEYHKVAKDLLKLEREFQGRSYDMLIGHATLVCVRYIFLELERRRTMDDRTCGELFFYFCDEIPDLKIREAILKIFQILEVFLTKICSGNKELIKACLEYFASTLPASIQRLLPNFG